MVCTVALVDAKAKNPPVMVNVMPATNFKPILLKPVAASPIVKVNVEVIVKVFVYPVQSNDLQAEFTLTVICPDVPASCTSSPDNGTTDPTQEPVAFQLPP